MRGWPPAAGRWGASYCRLVACETCVETDQVGSLEVAADLGRCRDFGESEP
jgi:hypothetical protein